MTVILRKLTRKSVLDFGRYNGYKVDDIFRMGNYGYLKWIYYGCSNLSFIDSVLDDLNIAVEDRINKPGKDIDKHNEIKSRFMDNLTDAEKDVIVKRTNKKFISSSKKRSAFMNNLDKKNYSGSSLQRRNHGNKY